MTDRIIKRQVPARGPLESHVINQIVEDTQVEVSRIAAKVTETEAELSRRRLDSALSRPAGANGNYQRRWENQVELASELQTIINTSEPQRKVFSFFDSEFVHYKVWDGMTATGYPVSHRCPVDTTYGQVILPYNGFKSLFWSATGDARSGSLFTPQVTVTRSEMSDVSAARIEASDPRSAFDGSSLDPYLIKAIYDVDTDVEEVRFDINIQVPQAIARQANVLTIEPAPELRCSIAGIQYSPTSVVANTNIPGIPTINDNNPLYDTNPQRFIFNTLFITSLKITLTSKHFSIENGRKVFTLGFREVGLFLVDWDSTWSNSPGSFTNNGLFVKLEIPQVAGITPTNCYFDDIVAVYTNDELAESVNAAGTSTGVRVMVFEDDTLTPVAFDSVGGTFPYTVSGNRDHLWLAVELDRNNTQGRVPTLDSLVVEYTVKS